MKVSIVPCTGSTLGALSLRHGSRAPFHYLDMDAGDMNGEALVLTTPLFCDRLT